MSTICSFKFALAVLLMMCCTPSQEQTGCQDNNALCNIWAGRGVCNTQQDFMRERCPRACGLCPTGTSPPPEIVTAEPGPGCYDINALCSEWVGRGICTTQQDFMRKNCPQTCGLCRTDTTPVSSPPPTTAKPDFGCHDINALCSEWVGRGICTTQQDLMRKNCPQTCRLCRTDTTPVSSPPPTIAKPDFVCGRFGGDALLSRQKRQLSGFLNANESVESTPRPFQVLTTPVPFPVGGGSDAPIGNVAVVITVPTGPPIGPGPPFPNERPNPTPGPRPVPNPRPVPVPRPVPNPRPVPVQNPPKPTPVQVSPVQGGNTPAVIQLTPARLEDSICGTVPITDRFLLTAAHCFPDPNQKFRVRLGELDFSQTGEMNSDPQEVDIEKIFIHPDYKHSTGVRYNDIALLKSAQRIHFSSVVVPYCVLPRSIDYTGTLLTVSGFGFVNSTHRSPVLQEAKLEGLNAAICEERYRAEDYEFVLRQTYPDLLQGRGILCAFAPGKSACQGDSGGPLTAKDWTGRTYLIGIVSSGVRSCGNEFAILPGLYTEVAHYIEWINEVIYGTQIGLEIIEGGKI